MSKIINTKTAEAMDSLLRAVEAPILDDLMRDGEALAMYPQKVRAAAQELRAAMYDGTDADRKGQLDAELELAICTLLKHCGFYGSERRVADAIYKAMSHKHTHPTNHQSFWRVIVALAKLYAKHEYVDLRNEASRDMCREMEDYYLPMI